jgi:hypothetical protein
MPLPHDVLARPDRFSWFLHGTDWDSFGFSAYSDQVESPDRKEYAPTQHVGACPCRKSGPTFPGHALTAAALQFSVHPGLKEPLDRISQSNQSRSPLRKSRAKAPRSIKMASWTPPCVQDARNHYANRCVVARTALASEIRCQIRQFRVRLQTEWAKHSIWAAADPKAGAGFGTNPPLYRPKRSRAACSM